MQSVEQAEKMSTPLFKTFANEWLECNASHWKGTYRHVLEGIIERHLIPHFGETEVGKIGEDEILNFQVVANSCGGGKKLSAGTVNAIMLPLTMILKDAAVRFGFGSHVADLRRLHVARPEVDPFSLKEVVLFVKNVREDYRRYYLIRFLTGMKDSEINGLKWCYVDFTNRAIYIRETLVAGKLYNEKKIELRRTIHMGGAVFEALKTQSEENAGRSDFVFCSAGGAPLNANIITNIWYPTLDAVRLRRRRPHQIRHTTAALWLSSGENPEWVARQLGCSSVRALLAMYWRFLPTRVQADGAAFDKMLSKRHFNV